MSRRQTVPDGKSVPAMAWEHSTHHTLRQYQTWRSRQIVLHATSVPDIAKAGSTIRHVSTGHQEASA
eukprot:3401569-Rhodomonas_salina.2